MVTIWSLHSKTPEWQNRNTRLEVSNEAQTVSHTEQRLSRLFESGILYFIRTCWISKRPSSIAHKLHWNCPCKAWIWLGTCTFRILLGLRRILGVNRQFISVRFKPGDSLLQNQKVIMVTGNWENRNSAKTAYQFFDFNPVVAV